MASSYDRAPAAGLSTRPTVPPGSDLSRRYVDSGGATADHEQVTTRSPAVHAIGKVGTLSLVSPEAMVVVLPGSIGRVVLGSGGRVVVVLLVVLVVVLVVLVVVVVAGRVELVGAELVAVGLVLAAMSVSLISQYEIDISERPANRLPWPPRREKARPPS